MATDLVTDSQFTVLRAAAFTDSGKVPGQILILLPGAVSVPRNASSAQLNDYRVASSFSNGFVADVDAGQRRARFSPFHWPSA